MEFPVRGQYLRRALIRLYMYEQRVFDGYLGVSTTGIEHTSVDAYTAGTENWPYLGCQWPGLSLVLKHLAHDGTFVDLGAGKGKALLIAGMLPYSRVVGIEIDNELTEVAQHNIKRLRTKQRAQVVECVTADAVDWKVPDDASVVFMHNPFFGATFRDAMANVFDSYDRNPRKMHIVYMFPWEHEWLLSTGRVAVESVKSEAWPRHPRWWAGEHVTVIYHVLGAHRSTYQCPSKSLRLSLARRRALERWRKPSEHNFSLDHNLRASSVTASATRGGNTPLRR